MKRTLLTLLAASSVAVALPMAANAQGWQSIASRERMLDQRIDVGVRNGALTASEAATLRADFNSLMRLETSYRRSSPGLTQWELQDLDRRFDVLSDRVDREIADNNRAGDRWGSGRGVTLQERRAQLDRRIDQGMRSGQLTRAEARDLRVEFNSIVRLERQYAVNGLTYSERNDLDRRYDQLADHIRMARTDSEREYGYGYGYNR